MEGIKVCRFWGGGGEGFDDDDDGQHDGMPVLFLYLGIH